MIVRYTKLGLFMQYEAPGDSVLLQVAPLPADPYAFGGVIYSDAE